MWKIEGILERIGLIGKPRVGLALSGGGAKGFSHIGVLMAMEKYDLRPEILSGVSAGSIAAVLYAAGLTPKDMIDCFAEYSRFGDFTEFTLPRESLFRMEKFSRIFESWLPVKYLEELSIPTVVCATDFDNGKSIGWTKGEIVPRVVASCSIPVIFPPKRINGVRYIDGGVLRNLPAWAIRKYCTTLYGSNCSPLKRGTNYKSSILDIAMRSYQLMAKSNTLQDLTLCDVIFSPRGTSEIRTFDVTMLERAVRQGYDAACKVLDELNRS